MLVFDTETTDLVANMTTRPDKQPEIIEFCGITLQPDTKRKITETSLEIVSVYETLIRPSRSIDPKITKITGISDETVRHENIFAFHAPQIRDLIEASDCVVAHNAMFDVMMVDIEFKKLGMTKIAWPRVICTVEATTHYKGYRLKLGELYEYLFGEKFEGAHRARADTEALARCAVELRKRGDI